MDSDHRIILQLVVGNARSAVEVTFAKTKHEENAIDLASPLTLFDMSVLDDVEVRHLPTANRSGAWNMALDAVAADRAAEEGIASVRVYGWEPSTLSLGYAQDPATIDWEYCERSGIHVTRRPTGGGAIYHDHVGDISYSIVVPSSRFSGDLIESYHQLCAPVITAFGNMGVDVSFASEERDGIYQPACYLRDLHPSHDLVVPGAQERKISGNAQYRRRSAIVQHGSLTYQLSTDRHIGCFTSNDISQSIFEEAVTAIDQHVEIPREKTVNALEVALRDWSGANDGSWADWELARAQQLVNEKFGAKSWVRDRVDRTAEV